MAYRYHHGDRPLEGYTILRGLGRGGFGEVYYAVSDGGRKVALKIIQQNHEIELRGVSQCMNLMSPHLVCIFDVKRNREGSPFVIMEYVSGPSLRAVIQAAPNGVGVAGAAFLASRIAQGLDVLHNNGIVHRDLKPENIFLEGEYAKIGDYGLSKYLSVSRQSGQTISVGTVHYMAPEIGSGNYNRGIDVYALGIIFYELLTGRVPFGGTSVGEILMKHLSAEPDLEAIEAPLRPILRKALAKDPTRRHAYARDFVDELFAVPDVEGLAAAVDGNSFSGLVSAREEPAPIALEWADTMTSSASPDDRRAEPSAPAPPPPVAAAAASPAPPPVDRARALPPEEPPARAPVAAPDLSLRSADGTRRLTHGAMTVAAMSAALALFSPHHGFEHFLAYMASIAVGAGALVFVEAWAAPRFQIDMGIARRLSVVAVAGAALVLCLSVLHSQLNVFNDLEQSLPALFASLLGVDWSRRVRTTRREQISVHNAFTAAAFGVVAVMLTDGDALLVGGLMASLSLVLNAVSPSQRSGVRSTGREGGHGGRRGAHPVAPPDAYRGGLSAGKVCSALVVGALVGCFSGAFEGAVVGVVLLVLFSIAGDHARSRAAHGGGWLVLGSVLMLVALVVAFAGHLASSEVGSFLVVEELGIHVADPLRELAQRGEHVFVAALLFAPALVCMLLARRWGGLPHVLRGAVAWSGVAVLTILAGRLFEFLPLLRGGAEAATVSPRFHETVIQVFVVGVVSAIFMAWPGRPRPPMVPPVRAREPVEREALATAERSEAVS